MTDKQAEALRLAQLMDAMDFEDTIDAATELRRLHARVVELQSQLEAIGAGGVESLRKKGNT